MEPLVKLHAYLDVNLIYFWRLYENLATSIKSGKYQRIAIAPANRVAEELVINLKSHDLWHEGIHIYDKNPDKEFAVGVCDYNKMRIHRPERTYIVSSRHADRIKKRLASLGIEESSIIDFAEGIPDLLTVDEALHHIYSAENENNLRSLFTLLGERDFAIISCPGFFYDIYDKVRIFKEDIQMDVVWMESVTHPVIDEAFGIIKCNIVDIINFIRIRERKSNILFFSLNSAWHLVVPYLMRSASPEIRIVIYMYEWLNFHFPYEHREIFQRFVSLPMKYIESEYRILEMILNGEVADGVIFKHGDGGGSFTVLDNYSKPKLFFPTYLSEELYQHPVDTEGETDKFVFLGALPPVMDDFELCEQTHIINAFSSLIKQGFILDVYEPRSQEIINEYANYFKDENNIRFIFGKPLDIQLPEIAGKYHWGFMAFDHSNIKILKKYIEIALPAKVYSYLALGVPIIITEELKFTAGLIREKGIGVVIASGDIPYLKDILSRVDYEMLKQNVLKYREEVCLENQKGAFIDYIQTITERRL